MLKIIIKTDFDFTPTGKRTVRIVQISRGGRQVRRYVGGRLCERGGDFASAMVWRDNTTNLLPQPWEALPNWL